MTGTSTSTPTTVESAAPDWKPKRAIAVATANSKKLLAPINAEGPAMHPLGPLLAGMTKPYSEDLRPRVVAAVAAGANCCAA
jgi:hypothetical protein